jgi:protein JSN1
MDSNGFEQYPMGMNNPMFMPGMPMTAQQQLQYQQLLAASRNNPVYPQMNGFQPPVSGIDYRNASPVAAPGFSGSPMLQPASLPQGFNPAMGGQMYPYGMYMPQQQQVAGGNQRRGRR